MKKMFTCLLLACTIFLLTSNSGFAQFKLRVVPQTGLNFNLHTGSDIESGSGLGLVIGGGVDMQFTNTIGLIANLQFYDNRSGSTSESGSAQYQDNQGNPVTSTITVDNSISLAYFMIEPLFKLSIPNSGFYFVVGPCVGFNVEGSSERTRTESFPPGYQNNDTKKTEKATMKETLVRFELKTGAGYDIWLSKSIALTSQLTFGYGITKVVKDVSWRVLTIQALAGCKISLI
jgi:Outer membrane protein beta-barrel domain